MKTQIVGLFFALILVSSSLPVEYEDYMVKGFEHIEHKFGGVHLKKVTAQGIESAVFWPEKGLFSEDEHHIDVHNVWLNSMKDPSAYGITDDMLMHCERSEKPGFFKFAPTYLVTLNSAVRSHSYSAPCFKSNQVEIHFIDSTTVEIIHHVGHRSGLCGEAYFYSTLINFHVEAYYLGGTHRVRFHHLTAEEMQHIRDVGIFVFRFCDKVINILPDFFKTLHLFIGGLGLNPHIPFFGSKPTQSQIHSNIKFIKESTGYEWKKRPHDVVVDIDPQLIQSGDFLAITRFDGLDQFIQWGSGGHIGHCTMALWHEGELYVVESQAAWYWPRKGLQINPFKQWIQWARNADFMVTWLPLKKEYAEQFNATAAYEWFKTVEGMPYGYHNFLYVAVDTVNGNYPPLLDGEFFIALFALIEKISPFAIREVFGLALNKRLGTEGLTIYEAAEVIYQRNLTFKEVFAMPEQDGWVYPDGFSYVCSCFVVAMWKAGGLFDGLDINAVEFSPRDLSMLSYLDPNPPVPKNCKTVDPQNPYCQLMGAWRMEFPGLSTIEPYDHMNEHCPTVPPLYERPDGC